MDRPAPLTGTGAVSLGGGRPKTIPLPRNHNPAYDFACHGKSLSELALWDLYADIPKLSQMR